MMRLYLSAELNPNPLVTNNLDDSIKEGAKGDKSQLFTKRIRDRGPRLRQLSLKLVSALNFWSRGLVRQENRSLNDRAVVDVSAD